MGVAPNGADTTSSDPAQQTSSRNPYLDQSRLSNPQQTHANGQGGSNIVNGNPNDVQYDSDARYSAESRSGRMRDIAGSRNVDDRSRSRTNGSTGQKSSNGQLRVCQKCGD